MISRGEDVEAQALKKRGWSISAIARHLGRDRKTIRAYLNGERQAGVRRLSQPGALEPYKDYLAARFTDDAHIWARYSRACPEPQSRGRSPTQESAR